MSLSSMEKRMSKRKSAYDEIMRTLIAEIERGVPPWIQPWRSAPLGMPANVVSGKIYTGINTLALWAATRRSEFDSRWWLTFRQARALGGSVRRGERGTTVMLWMRRSVSDVDDRGEEIEREKIVARAFTVFNVEQTDGTRTRALDEHRGTEEIVDRDERIEKWITAIGADIQHRGSAACYSRGSDRIVIPRRARFDDSHRYYATLAHELVHWTGHASRLNRDPGARFGDEAYAREELVAEIGASFVCGSFGLPGTVRHAAYLAHWMEQMTATPRLLVQCASAAARAAQYLDAVADENGAGTSSRRGAATPSRL